MDRRRVRVLALALAVFMLLAVVPSLASAIPAPVTTAQLSLPADWVKSYESPTKVDAWNPCADGANAAWVEDDPLTGCRIVMFDGATKTTKSWDVDGWAARPSLSGTRIAFVQSGDPGPRIRILDTETGKITDVTDGRMDVEELFLSGTKVVFCGTVDWMMKLYVYDLVTAETKLLADAGEGEISSPAVYGDRVVFDQWMPRFSSNGTGPQSVAAAGVELFPPGYSVGYVPLSGGPSHPISAVAAESAVRPAIWGSRAYWVQGPDYSGGPSIASPEAVSPAMSAETAAGQMYDFGASSLFALPLTPAANTETYLRVRGDMAVWASGAWVNARSLESDRRTSPTKSRVRPQGVTTPSAIRSDGQLNVRNMASGVQSAFMSSATFGGYAVGADMVIWSYADHANKTFRVIVAQYVKPAPAAPALWLGDPNVPWKVRRNRYFEVFGALSPAHKTDTKWVQLSFERWVGRRYRYQQTSTATSYSTGSPSQHYALRLKLKRSGRWRVRAFHPADSDGPDMWTGYHSFMVR